MTTRYRWHGSVQDFIDATRPSTIDRLVERLAPPTAFARADAHRRGETGSWTNSLPRVANVLQRAHLESAEVVLEYNPYQSGSARVDVIVAGRSPGGQNTYVVLEVKQWSSCERDPASGRVRGTGAVYEGDEGLKDPYEQARDYASFIRNYTEGMHDEDGVRIHPVAYLHNATEDSTRTVLSGDWQDGRHVFTGDFAGETRFIGALQSWFAAGADHAGVGRRLIEARYRQAPALLVAAGEILTNPENYPMSEQQGEIHAKVLHAVQQALSPMADRGRAVIVIKGGPGTGKTWIAMHLLGSNASAGRQVSYATNSSSLRKALAQRARQGLRMLDRPVDALITSARKFWAEEAWQNPLDVLMVDEAHRIEAYTVRGTGHRNKKEVQQLLEERQITQLYEVARSTKVLVLFIDEDQSITPKDDCSIERIKAVAERVGASYQEFELTEQHRSGGSEAYEAWVDALLEGTPKVWRDDENFRVRVAGTPQELESLTFDEAGTGPDDSGARLLAGFCWDWKRWPDGARGIEDIPFDIEIGDWKKRWNLRSGIDGYPADTAWASKPTGKDQVGSVFTAQGFEFGRCGVIIGPDFRWDPESDQWVVDVSQTRYGQLAAAAKRAVDPEGKADAEDLVRNHYRVLLTRAMAATTIYATDDATRAKLAELVNP